MIFQVRDHTYRVSFKHELFNPPIEIAANASDFSPYSGKKNLVIAKTTCFIVELIGDAQTGSRRPIAEGVAHCSAHENFDKAVGREYAFWRALKSVSPRPNKFWEMAIKAYSQSGAHRPDKEIQKEIQMMAAAA